jgi:membrane-associated protein
VTSCRFIPFFRTFVPFLAGMAEMKWKTSLPYSVLGGAGWVFACTLAGFFSGNIPFIKTDFELVVLCIIAISVVPIFIEFLKNRSNIRGQTELL